MIDSEWMVDRRCLSGQTLIRRECKACTQMLGRSKYLTTEIWRTSGSHFVGKEPR